MGLQGGRSDQKLSIRMASILIELISAFVMPIKKYFESPEIARNLSDNY